MLTLDANNPKPPLLTPWRNAIAMGRAYEILRADAFSHLAYVQKNLAFRYCRFHGLFHDDMAVCRRRPDGSLAFQWHQVDKVIDSLLSIGLRPFVELGSMPAALASGDTTIFEWQMNVTPPARWEEWGELVEAFARHVIDRYGSEEVRQWYFEVWNEPNLPGFWTGSQTDYWQLFKTAALALSQVDPSLRVGGPASSKGAWVKDLIAYCESDQVPIHFVSTHYYPQDQFNEGGEPVREGEDPTGFFLRKVKEVRAEVQSSSRPDLEIHFTEWNTLYATGRDTVTWIDNTMVDELGGAAMVARICTELDGTVDSLCYWAATDIFEESGMPHAAFSGSYGLISIHGFPKPNFHAFHLLSRMRGNRLQITDLPAANPARGGIATRDGDTLRVLLWRLHDDADQEVWQDRIEIPDGYASSTIVSTRIARTKGSAYETWCDLGKPQNLSPSMEALLHSHSQPDIQLVKNDREGDRSSLPFRLHPGELLQLEVVPVAPPALPKGRQEEEAAHWNRLMDQASR